MENSDKPKVRLRNGFSDRMGTKKENTNMQLNSFEQRTRTALANSLNLLWSAYSEDLAFDNSKNKILTNILSDVYIQRVSYNAQYNDNKVFELVNNTIMLDEYDDVLTVIEFIANELNNANYLLLYKKIDPFAYINSIFEKEFVAYRFLNMRIVPISDDIEIKAIQEAIESPYRQVNTHLDKALEKLSDRESPDYENSIKESISAVECMCSIIIGKSSTLGSALDKLEKAGLTIHSSMKSAFDKLYGYTSDGKGIRHAGKLDGANATFEEAKFMLVSCSAFINYLVGVLSKLKL